MSILSVIAAVNARNGRRLVPLFGAAALWLAATAGPARAQDDLREQVYGKPKTAAPKKKTKPNNVRSTEPQNSRPAQNQRAKTPPRRTYLEVTFLAREPMVEVFLNDRTIGVTDQNSRLSTKLTPGEYRLMAKNKREVLFSTKRIHIKPEQTTFKLFEEVVPTLEPTAEKPVEQPTPEDIGAKLIELSAEVRKILENYADPATTDSVTTDDWQFVYQAVQLNQLQGYTAVQIEAQRWFSSGQIELAKGNYMEAFTAFNKSQEYMRGSALPFFGLGNTYYADKRYADALKLFRRTLQIDPKMPMAHKRLGDTLTRLGKEKEAVAAYQTAIRLGYNTLETRFRLGTLLLDTKQTEEALKELEAIAVEMPRAEVFISIGTGYEKLKRDVSAIEAYEKALAADPQSALAHYRLGIVFLGQREYPKAKQSLEKAVALDPEGKTFDKTEARKKLREATEKAK